MHFGLDLRPSLVRPTGVGVYTLALAQRLPRLAPQHRFTYFSSSLRDRYPAVDWPPNARLVDRRIPVRLLNLAWNRLGWPPFDTLVGAPLDLVHSPHPLIVPCRKGRVVVTIHDLFFLKFPELTGAEIRRDYATQVRRHADLAQGVICDSEHTASDARKLLEVDPAKLKVIPIGFDPAYRIPAQPEEVEAVLARLELPRGCLLYVGSSEPRKNLPRLMEAHRILSERRSSTPPLVLVGPQQGLPSTERDVRATGYLPVGDVRALMASSAALVLASLEEGFGLPVLEAMAAGLPVVCSHGSALEEVAGGAACLVDPLDTASIADGIERVLDDQAYRLELRRLGLARSQDFDWDRAAEQTLAFYERVLAA